MPYCKFVIIYTIRNSRGMYKILLNSYDFKVITQRIEIMLNYFIAIICFSITIVYIH